MTLRHFEIFQTVCNLGSITAASHKLNMTQPAVSIAIQELEAFYQTKLFERMNRRLYITEPGKILLEYTDTVLTQFNESVNILKNEHYILNCRLGSNVTLAETYLSPLLSELYLEIPKLILTVSIHNTETIIQKLCCNELDFAIVDNITETKVFHEQLIYQERMCVVCTPNLWTKTMTIEELSKQPLLLREKGSGCRDSIDATFTRHGVKIVPSIESTSTLSLTELVKYSHGYTILSYPIIKQYLDSGELMEVKITNDEFIRHYYLIYHKKKHLSLRMMQLIQKIIEKLKKMQ